MKWRVWAVSLLAVVGILLLSANFIVRGILTNQLPGLLTSILGKPVTLEDVEVELFGLRATSAKFVIGEVDQPGFLAEGVEVEIDASALFVGKIRLVSVKADHASIDMSFWRDGNADKPINRAAINRWLPETAQLRTLAIYNGEKLISLSEDNAWERYRGEQQLLRWTQVGLASPLSVRVEFSPVFDLLDEQRGNVRVKVVRLVETDVLLSAELKITPQQTGIRHVIEFETKATTGRWEFETPALFEWPAASQLTIETLDMDAVQMALDLLDDSREEESGDLMLFPMPQLVLPAHELEVHIGEWLFYDEDIFYDEGISEIHADIVLQPATTESPPVIQLRGLTARLTDFDLAGDASAVVGAEWVVSLDLVADTQDRDSAVSAFYDDSDWLWRRAHATFATRGSTLIELLENAEGQFSASGTYLGAEELPLTLYAQFTSKRGLMGVDAFELEMGESKVTGSVWTDDNWRALNARLSSPYFNVNQLLRGEPSFDEEPAGVRVPDLRWIPADVLIDVTFAGTVLEIGGRRFTDVRLAWGQTAENANLDLALSTSAVGRIELHADTQRNGVEQVLRIGMSVDQVELSQFGVDVPISVSSGQIELSGRGESLSATVPNLAGEMTVQLTSEYLQDQVTVRAMPTFRTAENKVVAVLLEDLELALGDTQLINGRLQFDLIEPSIAGNLRAVKLNVDRLINVVDGTGAPATIAKQLDELIALDLKLQVQELTVQNQLLSDVELSLQAQNDALDISTLNFASKFGQVQGQGSLRTVGTEVELALSGTLDGFYANALTDTQIANILERPLVGTFNIASHGVDWSELVADARLRLQLKEQTNASEFDIDVSLQPQTNGTLATIHDMHWRDSDARGTVSFRNVEPRLLQMDITSDFVDLTPFESDPVTPGSIKPERQGIIQSIASATQQTLGLLSSTVTGSRANRPGQPGAESNSFFSTEPWSVTLLDAVVADIKLDAAQVQTRRGVARNVALRANVANRRLDLDIVSSEANGGPLGLSLVYDAAEIPPRVQLTAWLDNVRPKDDPDMAPMTVFLDLAGVGDNEAALAGSMVGQMYLAAGRGSGDYAILGAGLFTGDLVQNVFRKLLPKANEAPHLSCAVGYGEVVDGKFQTPAALVIRTREANILVRVQADLAEETLSAQFDSRSISGTGISVGNVFSDTVRLEGSLLAPKIVPDKKRLLWRYGAAVATGGMTLVGESLYKRLMADTDPCGSLRTEIRSQVCESDTPAAR